MLRLCARFSSYNLSTELLYLSWFRANLKNVYRFLFGLFPWYWETARFSRFCYSTSVGVLIILASTSFLK